MGNHVVAYDLASGRRTDVSHAGASRAIAASPDGRSVAFVATNTTPPFRGDLHVADADGRNVRTVLTTLKSDELPPSVAWSSDSRFFLLPPAEHGTTVAGGRDWR